MDEINEVDIPSSVLKAEHRTILRVLSVLEQLLSRSEHGAGFERRSFGRCVEFFRLFADACHHAKEEDLLFPALEARGIPREGGPIGCMLEEHRMARAFTKEMGEALSDWDRGDMGAVNRLHKSAHQYLDLLMQHINKEDNVLFQMGDRILSEDDQKTLNAKFREAGCLSFGGKKREELERIADELEAEWTAD